jgi:hypothetical protein
VKTIVQYLSSHVGDNLVQQVLTLMIQHVMCDSVAVCRAVVEIRFLFVVVIKCSFRAIFDLSESFFSFSFNPITGLNRPRGFQEVEAPSFQDNLNMEVVRLSALRTGRLYPQ